MKGLVYHYTSLDSFLKIIISGSFRLSYAQKLNDASEIKILIKDVYYRVIETCSNASILKSAHQFFKDFENDKEQYLNELPSQNLDNEHPQYLSMSCTTECDKANQWLCYGVNGEGVMMGFEEDYFNKLCGNLRRIGEDIFFRNVIYTGSTEYIELVENICNDVKIKLSKRAEDGDYWNDLEEIILNSLPFVKDKEFQFEKEKRLSWRRFLDIQPIENDYFVSRMEDDKKAFDLKIPKTGFLRTIIIGPCCSLRVDDAKTLLMAVGLEDVEVFCSESKLRKSC